MAPSEKPTDGEHRLYYVVTGAISAILYAVVFMATSLDGVVPFLLFAGAYWYLIKPWTNEVSKLIDGGGSSA